MSAHRQEPDVGPGLDADLDADLEALAGLVAGGAPVLVALDFDGVLAPFVARPPDARATRRAVAALARLGAVDGVHLALVSGRSLASLAQVAEVPDGTVLVGSHGAEHGSWSASQGLHQDPVDLDSGTAARYAELEAALDREVVGTTAQVEHKPTTLVLHTRTASQADRARLTAWALDLGARAGADVMHGKEMVELSVVTVTKGDALLALRDRLSAARVLYAGDDVTDERAFAALRPADVTVKVGEGASAARHRVADPDRVAALLHRLADLLGAPAA